MKHNLQKWFNEDLIENITLRDAVFPLISAAGTHLISKLEGIGLISKLEGICIVNGSALKKEASTSK